MVISGLKPGTSAAESDFKVGDCVIQIGDDLVAGFNAYEIFARLRGTRGSEVELVASRATKDGKSRISDYIERDVSLPPMQAQPGMDVKITKYCVTVTKVYDATSASHEGVQVGDTISIVDEEFVAGMEAKEILGLLQGLVGTSVEVTLSRLQDGAARRVTLDLVRDFKLVPLPLRSKFANLGISQLSLLSCPPFLLSKIFLLISTKMS